MASCPVEPEGLEWSDKEYTVSEVVELHNLPCIVRVSEGIYSAEDTESFSTGDCLKLHRLETVEKVLAYPVNSKRSADALETYKKTTSPILVPLDYRKRARVLLRRDLGACYSTVKDLLTEFPRYVEVGGWSIRGRHLHTREVIEIPPRSPLELIRVTKNLSTKSKTLICSYDKHELELEESCRGDFCPLEDPTLYTFRQIVQKFHLPQLVELPKNFIHDEKLLTREASTVLANVKNFQGQFILDRVDSEKKVLGTHRLDLENQCNVGESENYKRHQAVVIIPLSSDAEFQVATNRDTYIYDNVISMNFKTEVGALDLGGMYMDVQGARKSNRIAERDYEEIGDTMAEVYSEIDMTKVPGFFLSQTPPPRPPKRAPRDVSVKKAPSQQSPGAVGVTKSPYAEVAFTRKEAPPQRPPKRETIQQYKKPLPTPPSETTHYSSVTRPTPVARARANPNPNVSKPAKPKPSLAVSPTLSSARSPENTEDLYLRPFQPKPKEESVYEIKSKDESGWSDTLRCFSVEKVKQSLEELGFGDKASTFERMEIDGEYLTTMCSGEENVLQQEPFSLSLVDILKLKLFVAKGKVPIRKGTQTKGNT